MSDVQEPQVEVPTSEKRVCKAAVCCIITSLILFCSAMAYLINVKRRDIIFCRDHVVSANFLISLVVLSMTAYQLALSVILFIVTRKPIVSRPSMISVSSNRCVLMTYVITVWYISHLSILPTYWVLYILELAVTLAANKCAQALVATFVTVVYQSIFTYSVVIIYRFLKTNGLI